MTTLTTLPLSLQSRILSYVCDIRLVHERALLHGTIYCLPSRYLKTQLSLDGLRAIDAPIPAELLAPALASPVLAAAAEKVIGPRLSYLTDVNTGGNLPLWVKAFGMYVHSVGVNDVGEIWKDALPRHLRRKMAHKLCWDAVDLFRETTLNQVRLKVLDLVNVPFDRCERIQDALMTGLCSTLETCQSTLKELALPVYPKSDLCTRALETITLPRLTVLSIEVNDKRKLHKYRGWEEGDHLSRQLLDMMQAVDGHADRLHGLTTLEELRLINACSVPCTSARDSGCSSGFFHAIKTLRMTMSFGSRWMDFREVEFFRLFRELESLHCTTAMAGPWVHTFERMSKRLKEVNLCHPQWITGAQIGMQYAMSYGIFRADTVFDAIGLSNGKSRTVVTHGPMRSCHLRRIARSCPNLGYLSLHASSANLSALGDLIQQCEQLEGLQILIDEHKVKLLGEQGWLRLGEVIPRCHQKLRDVAIETGWNYAGPRIRADTAVKCFKTVIERMGARAERLFFRARLEVKSMERAISAVRCVLDSCVEHARVLSDLQIDLLSWKCVRNMETKEGSSEAVLKLASSRDGLIQSQLRLNQLDLGLCNRILHKVEPRLEMSSLAKLP